MATHSTMYAAAVAVPTPAYEGAIIDEPTRAQADAALADRLGVDATVDAIRSEADAKAQLAQLQQQQQQMVATHEVLIDEYAKNKKAQEALKGSLQDVARIASEDSQRLTKLEVRVDELPRLDDVVKMAATVINEGSRARQDAEDGVKQIQEQRNEMTALSTQFTELVEQRSETFAQLEEGHTERSRLFWEEQERRAAAFWEGLPVQVDSVIREEIGSKEMLVGGRQTGIEEWSWQWAPLAEPENITRETPMVVRVGAQGPQGRTVASGGGGSGSGGAAGYSCELPLPAGTEIQLQFRLPGQSVGRSPERSASIIYQFDGDITGNWAAGTLHISSVRDLGGTSSFTVGNELEGQITSRLEFRTVARTDASNQVDVYVTSETNGTIRCRLIDLYQV